MPSLKQSLPRRNCRLGTFRPAYRKIRIFYMLAEAQVMSDQWRGHYNRVRPHSALGKRPPVPEVTLTERPPTSPEPPGSDFRIGRLQRKMRPNSGVRSESNTHTQWLTHDSSLETSEKDLTMRRLANKLLPSFAHRLVKRGLQIIEWDPWQQKSWSQEGEDQILRRVFESDPSGFYVDVGAHHPMRFSNTYLFYKRGWRGINVDAMPGSMAVFNRHRPRDINLEVGVGPIEGSKPYYMFQEPALNGFSKELSEAREASTNPQKLLEVKCIKVLRLSTLLNAHLPRGQSISFLSVDVEGMDLEVLQSNDWTKYRPRVVLIEMLGTNLGEISDSQIGCFMRGNGYLAFAKCFHSVLFRDSSALGATIEKSS